LRQALRGSSDITDVGAYSAAPGLLAIPGVAYDMIVPTGVDASGMIDTDYATIVSGGVQFIVHIDNRSCSAEIEPPAIGTSIVDDCGFLRHGLVY